MAWKKRAGDVGPYEVSADRDSFVVELDVINDIKLVLMSQVYVHLCQDEVDAIRAGCAKLEGEHAEVLVRLLHRSMFLAEEI